jgi:type I restriction enzyme R subunit
MTSWCSAGAARLPPSPKTTIRDVLDADLAADPYPLQLFEAKVQVIFDHTLTAYGDDETSIYDGDDIPLAPIGARVAVATLPDLSAVAEEAVEGIGVDTDFALIVAEQLGLVGSAALRTVAEIIENDEDFAVEFKSTARCDLKEDGPNKAMEDEVVKSVAGFPNADGGTLLIGVGPDGAVIGLDHDYPRVRPPNGDGFANWLTTYLTNALGHSAVIRTRARIVVYDEYEIARLDVGRSSRPVWVKASSADRAFFVRMNNSTRVLPDEEMEAYLADRWGVSGARLPPARPT